MPRGLIEAQKKVSAKSSSPGDELLVANSKSSSPGDELLVANFSSRFSLVDFLCASNLSDAFSFFLVLNLGNNSVFLRFTMQTPLKDKQKQEKPVRKLICA